MHILRIPLLLQVLEQAIVLQCAMDTALQVAVLGEGEEFACAFPHLRAPVERMARALDALCTHATSALEQVMPRSLIEILRN